MGEGTGTAKWVLPKFYLVKIHWIDGTSFACEITQPNIDNFKEVAQVAKVEVLKEL